MLFSIPDPALAPQRARSFGRGYILAALRASPDSYPILDPTLGRPSGPAWFCMEFGIWNFSFSWRGINEPSARDPTLGRPSGPAWFCLDFGIWVLSGFWDLDFIWILGFGIWNFSFSNRGINEPSARDPTLGRPSGPAWFCLDFGIWVLSGFWNLGFGISLLAGGG